MEEMSKVEMSIVEIVASYKQAAKPEEQIKVLAELNACPVAEIERILDEAGVREPPKRRAGRPRKSAASKPVPAKAKAVPPPSEETAPASVGGVQLSPAVADTLRAMLGAWTTAEDGERGEVAELILGALGAVLF